MLAKVVPARRLPASISTLDYLAPKELESKLAIGQLVRIPLQNHLEFGVVVDLDNNNDSELKLKLINEIVIDRPLLGDSQIKFLIEISELYAAPLGFLIKSSLPPLKSTKLAKISASPSNGVKKENGVKPSLIVYRGKAERLDYLKKFIEHNGQTLILCPEVAGASSLYGDLVSSCGEVCSLITSELGDKELFDQWFKIWNGEIKIVIGTRRALFLSYFDLASIVMDDEGNPNYKSWDMAPRFNALDAVLLLSRHHNAALTLMSFTPSVESYYFAKKNVYDYKSADILPIKARIIDMSGDRRTGNSGAISAYLSKKIIENDQGQTFLFLNRRGDQNYIACGDCQKVSRCPNCDQPLTFYQDAGNLICLHCAHREPMRESCPACGGAKLVQRGLGITGLVKEARKLVDMKRKIVKIEKDDASIAPANLGDIVIGTQFAWNSLDWKAISLMAFVDADQPLFIPEYKMAESLWQSIRAARFCLPKEANLCLQTFHPDQAIFKSLSEPESFYDRELTARKMFGYPPFKYLAKFWYKNSSQKICEEAAGALYARLSRLTKGNFDITISPNQPLFPYRKGGFYGQVIIAKLSYKNYKTNLKFLNGHIPPTWKVDPNPQTLLSV